MAKSFEEKYILYSKIDDNTYYKNNLTISTEDNKLFIINFYNEECSYNGFYNKHISFNDEDCLMVIYTSKYCVKNFADDKIIIKFTQIGYNQFKECFDNISEHKIFSIRSTKINKGIEEVYGLYN